MKNLNHILTKLLQIFLGRSIDYIVVYGKEAKGTIRCVNETECKSKW